MKVYYGSYSKVQLLKEVGNRQEAFKFISEDIRKNNYKSYYMRCLEHHDGTCQIDYGSYTKFYFIKED